MILLVYGDLSRAYLDTFLGHFPTRLTKLTESSQPSSLSGFQITLGKKVPQLTMITHHNKPPAKKIMPPHIQGMNDNYQLEIMSHIVLLVVIQLP